MSRPTGDHTAWQELIAGHALHALDAADEAALAGHLDECETCRTELDAHLLTAAQLGALADDPGTTPPTWSQLREAVVGKDPEPVVALSGRRAGGGPTRWLLAAAAVIVVLAGATVAGLQVVRSDTGSGNTPVAFASCHLVKGCVAVDLRSSTGSRRATVLVTHGVARVQPVAMSSLASGRTFVLWQLPRDGGPIALGEFTSTRTLSAPSKLAVAMARTTGFAVSSEAAGAPPDKPTDVLALGGVTS